ncbi:MAG: hypothetical protein AAFV53_43505 [Myxococcota bacterium]
MRSRLPILMLLVGCGPSPLDSGQPDPCEGPDARSMCRQPVLSPEYYIAESDGYFDTMDYTADLTREMPYAEQVARWEWPPWLLLTAFGRENIEFTDTLLRWYPSVVRERDCRAFDTQPFGRCRVVFYYDAHDGLPCPIYEEFTFNDDGEITFIEAWSDVPGLLPMGDDDPWAEDADNGRLSTRIPGLGTSLGDIDLYGAAMADAADDDPDVADFVRRADDWYNTWVETFAAAGDEMWTVGCGWDLR